MLRNPHPALDEVSSPTVGVAVRVMSAAVVRMNDSFAWKNGLELLVAVFTDVRQVVAGLQERWEVLGVRRRNGSHRSVGQLLRVRLPVRLDHPSIVRLSGPAERNQRPGCRKLHGVMLEFFPILVRLGSLAFPPGVPQHMARVVHKSHHYGVD